MAATETSFPMPVMGMFFEQEHHAKNRQAEEARSELPPSSLLAAIQTDVTTNQLPKKRRLFAAAVEDPKQEWRMRSDEVAFIVHLCNTLSRIAMSFTSLVDIGLVTMAWSMASWGAMTAASIRFRSPEEDAVSRRLHSSSPIANRRRPSVASPDKVTWSDDESGGGVTEEKENRITEPQDHAQSLLNAAMSISSTLASKELVSYVHAERFSECLQQASNAIVFTTAAWSLYLGQLRSFYPAEAKYREEQIQAYSHLHEPIIGRLLLKIFTPLLQHHLTSAKAEASNAVRMHVEIEEDRRLQYRSTVAFVRAVEESHRLIKVYSKRLTNVHRLPLHFGPQDEGGNSSSISNPLSLLQSLLTKISEDVAANVLYVQQQQQRVRWESEQQQKITKSDGRTMKDTPHHSLLMTDLRQTSVPWHVPFWRECVRVCTLLGNLQEAEGGSIHNVQKSYYNRQNEHEGYWSLATSMIRLLPSDCTGFEHDNFSGAHLNGDSQTQAGKGVMQSAVDPLSALPATKESNRSRIAADADDWDDYATWSESQHQQAGKQPGRPYSNMEQVLKGVYNPSSSSPGTQPPLRLAPLMLAALNYLNAAVEASLTTNGQRREKKTRSDLEESSRIHAVNGFHLAGEYLSAFGELLGTRSGARVPFKGGGGGEGGVRIDTALLSYMYQASGIMIGIAADQCEDKLQGFSQRRAQMCTQIVADGNQPNIIQEVIDSLESDGENVNLDGDSGASKQRILAALESRERSLGACAQSLRAQQLKLQSMTKRI